MDVIEWFTESPFFFRIVNLELAIGWNAVWCQLVNIEGDVEIDELAWLDGGKICADDYGFWVFLG